MKGGYRLARDPATITVADIVQAIEGPISITECTNVESVNCSIAAMCAVKSNWQTINRVVLEAISGIARRRQDAANGTTWDPSLPLLADRGHDPA